MAYKRKRSFGKKRMYRKKMRKFVRRRRSNFSRARFRPEVKYVSNNVWYEYVINNLNNGTAFSAVSSSFYAQLNTFPSQGLTDTHRIGDTIHGVKTWVKFRLTLTATYDCACIRVFICNFKIAPVSPQTIFQANVQDPVMGVLDLEKINKVFYDKTFAMNSPGTLQAVTRKPISVNIPMRWPIIFSAASTDPKDYRNRIFMFVLPSVPGVATTSTTVRVSAYCNFYFYDN